jgi:hypothetical protein
LTTFAAPGVTEVENTHGLVTILHHHGVNGTTGTGLREVELVADNRSETKLGCGHRGQRAGGEVARRERVGVIGGAVVLE